MKKNLGRGGFTLLELLVVVGIISVLSLLSIAVFSASRDSAEKAACMANCRNMKAQLSYGILLDGAEPATLFQKVGTDYTCPSGGEYSLKYDAASSTVNVICSIHGSAEASVNPIAAALKKLNQLLEEHAEDFLSSAYIDSGAPDTLDGKTGSRTALLKKLMREAGLDPDALGINSWAIETRKGADGKSHISNIFWTSEDISKLPAGSKVIVAKYNFDDCSNPAYKNMYSVWECQVGSTADESTGRKTGDIDYNVLIGGSAKETDASKKRTDEEKRDPDIMMQVYKDAIAASGNS